MRITAEAHGLDILRPSVWKTAQRRAYRKAGRTAARDMRSEAKKRIRARKRLKAKLVARALTLRAPRGARLEDMEIGIEVGGGRVPLTAYPYSRTRRGVTVGVNKGGGRTLLEDAFVARLASGHVGIFRRRGGSRLPIDELLGSRPVDALLHRGEAKGVLERGAATLAARFPALLQIEIDKSR